MSQEWDGKPLEDVACQDGALQEEGMSVWQFLEHMDAGRLLRVTSAEAFSLALDEVYLEMYHNVLKRVSPSPFSSPHVSLLILTLSLKRCSILAGLHVEKRTRTQELDRTLVCSEAILHGLLCQRGLEGQARRDPAG